MPTYTILAGVNGAGKTSIYKCIYYNENTDVLKEVIYFKNGKLIWQDKKIPNWANNILKK